MKFLDERIEFDFSIFTNTYPSGLYRYDVVIDGEISFIGNIFLDSTINSPVIDVTDIVRNYYVTNHNFPNTPTKSKLIRKVEVTLYTQNQQDEETLTENVYMIYRQPNYKSQVTTPILDSATSVGSEPLLQGWDYLIHKSPFLPTYPKVQSEVLDFDFTGLFPDVDINHTLYIRYYDDTLERKIALTKTGESGAYDYSIGLGDLLTGYTFLKEKYESILNFLTTKDVQWKVGYPLEDGVRVLKANYIGNISTIFVNLAVILSSKIIPANHTSDEEKIYWNLELPLREGDIKSEGFYLSFTSDDGFTKLQVPFEFDISLLEEYLDKGTCTLYFSGEFDITNETLEITIKLKVGENVYYTVCDTDGIEILISPLKENNEIIPSISYRYRIANLDGESRYFLKWRDRYGMSQIQPFKGTFTYKESIKSNTITNWKREKKLIDSTVQGSWRLNTDWISEKLYPFYESIFVSPWLQLYDSKEDKLYDVVLTNTEYDEKTFNNQSRNLFNLQLEVELSTTQNIIY